MRKNYQAVLFTFLLLFLFFLQFLIISPFHEFPLNDDWVHTDTIKHWAETGKFRMLPFAGPTFYVPILYGTVLVKIFGFSFSLLRISTLALTGATLMLLYFFLIRLGAKPILALIGALTFWLNPLTYNLSFTFMTDIPALFLLLASIVCYYEGFKKSPPLVGEGEGGVRFSTIWLFLGSLLSIAGFFTRQTNILLLVAAGMYAIINSLPSEGRVRERSSVSILFSFLLPLLIGAGFYAFLASKNLLPQSAGTHIIEGDGRLLGHIKWWLWYTPLYLGLFLLPLTGGWIIKHKDIWKKYSFQFFLLFLVSSAFAIRQFFHLQFPYVRNMLSIYGLGPMNDVLAGALIPLAPPFVWTLVTALSAIGAGLLISIMFYSKKIPPFTFLFIFTLLYLLTLLLFESFDRYYLPLLLVFIILIIQKIKDTQFSYAFALLLLVPVALFSVSQTHHYITWNHARWKLADSIEMTHTINAGYEWNGWYGYWVADAWRQANPDVQSDSLYWWIRTLFPNNTETFVVSFSPLEGYEYMNHQELRVWNPNKNIYLLSQIRHPIEKR